MQSIPTESLGLYHLISVSTRENLRSECKLATFSRSAVQVTQGNLSLYLTYVTPEDLFADDFYAIEKLEPSTQDGFQRILDDRRVNRLARHLAEADPEGYAHLPTTVFLATDKQVNFDKERSKLEFDTSDVCPFSVVDGQHRIEGLRRAVERENNLWGFRLPVTIATNLDHTHQMYHFYIVNTTQVPVDASLRQQITRRFTDMQGVDDLPYMPFWLEREIGRGRDARALKIVEALNADSRSPLLGKIQMANDPDPRDKIKQSSIVNLVKSEVLTPSNPLAGQETDTEKQARIIINFLRAADAILVHGRDRNETVIYKSNGLFFLLGVSKWVFNSIYSTTKDFRVDSLKDCLQAGFDGLDDVHHVVANPDWWMPGPLGGSGLNRSAARGYVDAFQQSLAEVQQSEILI